MQYMIGAIFIITFLIVWFFTKSWFSVARIHTAIWMVLYWGYCICSGGELRYFGVLWLIASCYFLLIGERLGEKSADRSDMIQSPVLPSAKRDLLWTSAIGILTVVSIAGNIAEVYAYGFGVGDLLSLQKILHMSNQIAVMRYSGVEISSVLTLLQNHKYIACLIGGYYFLSCEKAIRKIVCCLPFIPVILNVIIENTKAGVIASAILFCIGLIIGYATTHFKYLTFTVKGALRFLIAGGVLLVLLFFAMVIRLGEINAEAIRVALAKFSVYAFGNVQAFDLWLSTLYHPGNFGFGVNTFMAPFDVLGIVTREQGVYGFIEGAASNVFSGYRGVIEDFGVLGGFAFVMLLGFVGGRCIKRIIQSPQKVLPKVGYLFVMFFVSYSIIVSPYVYTTFCLTIVEFAALLYIEKYTCLNR